MQVTENKDKNERFVRISYLLSYQLLSRYNLDILLLAATFQISLLSLLLSEHIDKFLRLF